MEFSANVKIAALRGGYIVSTEELDNVTQEWETHHRVCLSIHELIPHVIRALESADRWEPKGYDKIEKTLNG